MRFLNSSIQDTPCTDASGNHSGLFPSQDLQRSLKSGGPLPATSQAHSPEGPAGLDLGDASRSSPELDRRVLHPPLPDPQLTFATTVLGNSDELLPDTQISTNSKQATPESVITLLHSDSSLPDTQAHDLDLKWPSGNPTFENNSQLLDTQNFELQSIYTNESVHVHSDDLLPDTQSSTRRLKYHLPPITIPTIPHSQIKHLATEDLLPDTQSSIDGAAATSSTPRTSIQNDKDLPDTQVSSGDQPHSCISALQSSSKSGIDSAASAPSTAVTSVRNGGDLPDTQVSSVGKLESSYSTQESSLKTCFNVKAPSMQSSPSKQSPNKATCRERKRIIVSFNRPPALTKAMCQWIDKTNYLLDPFREDDECWFHPSPPAGHLSMNGILRPCGKLQRRFNWQDRNGKHSLVLNFGIVSKLVNYKMTKQQKDGFINKQWHLSRKLLGDTILSIRICCVGNFLVPREQCLVSPETFLTRQLLTPLLPRPLR